MSVSRAVRHLPPSADMPVGARRALAKGMAIAWLLGAVVGVAFLWMMPLVRETLWRWACVALSLPLSACWACYCLKSIPQGSLRWSPAHRWRWIAANPEVRGEPSGRACELRVNLDFQWAVLLGIRLDAAPGQPELRWLWVERTTATARADWLAFRRAVYSPARPEAADIAKPEPS